jgi:hypothetical protein
MLIKPTFLYVTQIVLLIVAAGVPFLWKRSTWPQRCAIIYLVEMALSGLVEFIMSSKGIHNIWVIHLSTILEFIILMLMFYLWEKNILKKRILLLTGCVFIAFWLIAKVTFESIEYMDVYTSIIAQTIYIVCAVSLLFDVLKDAHTSVQNDARAWISAGLLIYSAGTLIVVSLFNVLSTSMPELLNAVWHINWILIILVTLFFARGIWCRTTQ